MQDIPVFMDPRRNLGRKLGRIWGLAALAVGIWLLAAYGQHRPAPLGLDAHATQFSAARADAVMARLLDGQQPRPAGSAQNAALRARLVEELARLGVTGRTQTGLSCAARGGFVTCGTVTNVIADIAPGRGTPLLLMAHLDSVAAVQRAIVEGMQRGGSFGTSHKEGGTSIFWRDGKFIRSDYGDDPDYKLFTDEAEFLKMLWQFSQFDVTRTAGTQPLPEFDVWKLILRRMRLE